MFCSNCGRQIDGNARFCSFCGTVQQVYPVESHPKREAVVREGTIHKCPHCGESLSFDAIICPACGREIRGKEANETVSELMYRLNAENDENKKIEIIRLFPIPSTREDILEFMITAVSNFDANSYTRSNSTNNLSAAWLSKIDQCYRKGKLLFEDPKDINKMNRLYQEVHGSEGSIKSAKKNKTIKIAVGISLIIVGLCLVMLIGDNSSSPLAIIALAPLAVGIILLVLGLKKEKKEDESKKQK